MLEEDFITVWSFVQMSLADKKKTESRLKIFPESCCCITTKNEFLSYDTKVMSQDSQFKSLFCVKISTEN